MNAPPQKIGRTAKIVSSRLKSIYSDTESHSITRILIEAITQQPYLQSIIHPDKLINWEEKNRIEGWLVRLEAGEPVQYVLERAWFYDREFKVGPGVLIPRGETEELADLIIKDHEKNLPSKILDIGTGSGVIPIVLALTFPFAEVFALDISETALKIARENAIMHKAKVHFRQADVLKAGKTQFQELDILVSNPPYVTEEDRELVPDLVLNHEPHLALFPASEDPLIFYKTIARLGFTWLRSGGYLYFEINESKGPQTKLVVEEAGYNEVELIQDLSGKDRFVKGRK